MVATIDKTPPAERFGQVPATASRDRWAVMRFTVADVQVLLEQGVLPEDATTELLNGLIVRKNRADVGGDPMSIGLGHRRSVILLADLNVRWPTTASHVASQQPVQCAIDHLPEPDFAVIRGRLDDYIDRYPTGADLLCIVEVAASSYPIDSGEKLFAYARAGVRQYVIINLNNRTAEVYTDPDVAGGTYGTKITVAESGTLALRVGEAETFDVPLAELLP